MTTQAVRIKLFGSFGISVGSRSIEDDRWQLRKAKSLVKLLALAQGHRLHREQVMERLWPNSRPDAAANSLYQTVHHVRRVIDPDSSGPFSPYLRLRNEELVLCPEVPLWTDVEAFESAAAASRRTRDPASYRAAVELYAGEILPEDRYEEWTESRREGLRALYQELLIELARLHEERGEFKAAIDTLRRVLTSEPAHEETHRELMRLYATAGQRDRALRQYERLREVLRRELGLKPGMASEHLYQEISSGRFPPTEPASVSVRKAANVRRHNLPLQLTSFVGRQREMAEIQQLLTASRLVTLTGAGGSGKTRLAVTVATELLSEYADGVWLVELAPLVNSTRVPKAVAAALGVREEPGRELLGTLVDYLRHRELLLLLDNCEHLVEACASLARSLLSECPYLRILATSREALRIGGEANWLVPSLSVPAPGVLPPAGHLIDYEAVRLFVDRVRSHRPSFELTAESARSVAEICQRLEGMPLAIELAAARAQAMAVSQIATRLDNSLRLLTGGDRTATPRQQTLKGALEWSYDLLSRSERELFCRLSVFAGGFTLEAAEALMSAKREPEEVSQLLSQLVDKSLVVAEESGGGSLRYRMLEPVRQYGRQRLEESGRAERVRERHAEYYLALAEEAEPELRGARQIVWLKRLDREQDNLRAAMAWSLESGEEGGRAELRLRLAAALWQFWDVEGFEEGKRWLHTALEKDPGGFPAVRAKALGGLGWILLFQRDYGRAIAALEEAIALHKELGDESGAALALGNLGYAVLHGGCRERVPAFVEEAEALMQGDLDGHTRAFLRMVSASAAMEGGELESAVAQLEESLALCRELGDLRNASMSLFTLGMAELKRDDLDRGAALLEEGARISRELGDRLGGLYYVWGLGKVNALRGRPIRAARLWGAAEAQRERMGVSLSHFDLAHSGYEQDLARARFSLDERAWVAAWTAGRAMSPEAAIKYALSAEDTSPGAVPQPRAAAPPNHLTRREQEVAILVARELTNRQIASELVLSERTVETHVRNILGKLGLRSRAQLAPWLTEQGLLGQD